MKVNQRGKVSFDSNWERLAYITMEYVTGSKTQTELAAVTGLSPLRVHQIIKAGLARSGAPPTTPPSIIAYKLRKALFDPKPQPHTPEYFFEYERFGSYS